MSRINRDKFFACFTANPPTTQGAAIQFVDGLNHQGLLFHWDDDPKEIISAGQPDRRTFTDEEAEALTQTIIPALLKCPLPAYDNDPFALSLAVLNNSSREPLFVYPKWGVNFDDEPQNRWQIYLKPDSWNGWAKGFATFETLWELLFSTRDDDGGQYDVEWTRADEEVQALMLTDRTTKEVTIIPRQTILTTLGYQSVYDLDFFGWAMNPNDCLEVNPNHWEGY